MAATEPYRIFISYARKDGAILAQRLQVSLQENGFDAWLDTQRIGAGAVWSTQIEREVDTREVTLALLSPGSYASEICRAEQLRALDKGKRVIPLLAVTGADRPIFLYARQYRDFTDEGSYPARLGDLLADIRGNATATLPDAYCKTRVTYITAPPRVANYLERPEALHALRDALFCEDHRQPIALTALAGMGGIGKTVLAKALTEDEVVQRAFPHGIVWITAGKERKRDFIEEMREVAKALGDDPSRYDSALASENQYRTTIANKAALVVVDDVWSKSEIEPLLAESPRSRFLFTTRDATIGSFVGAREHQADLLDVAQSRRLLASWANVPIAELHPAADEVIHECGRLPLALAVVGAMLRDANAESWRDMLDLLRRADLSTIEEQLPPGQESFFRAVEVSFQSLRPEMQERYKALAVLLEDMSAPLPLLEALWNVNRPEARRSARIFVGRSLAQRNSDDSIRLHDLQLDYVRAQHPDKKALELIHSFIRLSSNVITKDPAQFVSQAVGRLAAHEESPAISRFTEGIVDGTKRPWLRALRPTLHPPGTSLIRTLEGHRNYVNAVVLMPGARRAVSASSDGTLKVWDVENGRDVRTLEGHARFVECVAVTVNGQLAVSGSRDKTLKTWDVENGLELRTLTGHADWVTGVAVSDDGRLAVSASRDHTLKVWDLQSGRELRTLEGHAAAVLCVALSANGRLAVSGSADTKLKLWDVEKGQELRTMTGHAAAVLCVALSANGRLAVSGSADTKLKVWDLENGVKLRTLSGHSHEVYGVATDKDFTLAISGSGDKTLKLWDVESGRKLRIMIGHTDEVYGVAMDRAGALAVSASKDKTLKAWHMESGTELDKNKQGHTDWVRDVAVSRNSQLAISASRDETLIIWDLETGHPIRSLEGNQFRLRAVSLSNDGQLAVSASTDGTLKLWDVETGHEIRTVRYHYQFACRDTAINANTRLVVCAYADGILKVCDLDSGREVHTLNARRGVNSVALSADGRLAISASGRHLIVWDLERGLERCRLEGHSRKVSCIALSGNGRIAVSGSKDQVLKVWDLESGRELRTIAGHTGSVSSVALNDVGTLAVSASGDKTLKLWEIPSGVLVATFTCDGAVRCCALADRGRIVAGDAGGQVHFLSLENYVTF